MSARKKLNAAYLNGALLLAGAAGILSGSWSVFAVAFAGVVIGNIIAGSIRFGSSNRK
jgi:hypothetical protein